ncbi:MAG: CocE/NonD family hydrolase [Bryobacteraceae bacterium]
MLFKPIEAGDPGTKQPKAGSPRIKVRFLRRHLNDANTWKHLFCLALALFPAFRLLAAEEFSVRENYTKYEFRIPARDGKRLFTAVYIPKDRSKTYPIVLMRTPYSVAPYGEDIYLKSLYPGEEFEREGFIFAYQDVRGRYMSEGEWKEMTPHLETKRGKTDVDESTDTYDTIDWLVKNVPDNNGKVGLLGISYPGFYSSAGIIDAHPALVAASPQAPIADLYMGDDAFHNGAFFLAANFGFYLDFFKHEGLVTPDHEQKVDVPFKDGYRFYLNLGALANADEEYLKYKNPYWTDIIAHPNYDQFWQSRNLLPHLRNIKPAILVVGGWYDAEDLSGTLKTWRAIGANGNPPVNRIVMGPWVHGGWSHGDGSKLGDIDFAAKTAVYFRKEIQFPFFRYYLKGGAAPPNPKAVMFETGDNQWHEYAKWPPEEAQLAKLYLHAGGKLTFDPPSEIEVATDGASAGKAFDEYRSDPNHPVPFFGKVVPEMAREYMTGDQRFAATRSDVLTYETEPLEQDMIIAGPVTPVLHVSTTGTDSDFVVKLIDVSPADYPNPEPNPEEVEMGGYEQLVRGEPFRGKFRNSFEKPEPFTSGKVEEIRFTMPDIDHCFRRGHRIMVQIQSSWFPLVDRNPQVFTNIPTAKPSDFKIATERVYRTKAQPTYLEFLVIRSTPAGN